MFAGPALGIRHDSKHLANHTTTPPATSLVIYNNRHQIKKTPRNAPQPIDLLFRSLIASRPSKQLLDSFVIEMQYRHKSPLTLTLRNGLQRSPQPDLPPN
jgi:hypothetical protein